MAEVLITLGIIGVVAAIILPSLITNIQNKGYVERLKKAQTVLQVTTNQLINEGEAIWVNAREIKETQDQETAEKAWNSVFNNYASKMKAVRTCPVSASGAATACYGSIWLDYYRLNGLGGNTYSPAPFWGTYTIVLADGMVIGIRLSTTPTGNVYWGGPPVHFTVDVNGKSKPNKLGRDIFYLYIDDIEKGKVLPYGDGKYGSADDCNKDGIGSGCAYKVVTEGGMNY